MKMIRRYAIEPRALRRWEDFRYVMEKMGFCEGRVVVTLPKGWVRELLNSINDAGDIQRARFTTKLQRYKEDRIVSSRFPYDSQVRWLDNARALERQGSLDAVLIAEETVDADEAPIYCSPSTVDEDFFAATREIRCISTVENIAEAGRILLDESVEATFVDPYWKIASKMCVSTLTEFAKHAMLGGRCRSFIVFTRSDYAPKGGQCVVDTIFDKEIAPVVSPGFRIQVNFVNVESAGGNFHARYLITNKGGLRYDKGLCAKIPPDLVDISLLDRSIHSDLVRIYAKSNGTLKVSYSCEWVAKPQE